MTADEFRATRTRLGMSLTDMSEALGVSRSTVARYQSGDLAIPARVVKHLRLLRRRHIDDGYCRPG
jgi:predicted transcriptional regulator